MTSPSLHVERIVAAYDRTTLDGEDPLPGLGRRETLQERCNANGVSCLSVSAHITIPEATGIAGSEHLSSGGTLYLINDQGGSGSAQCQGSVVRWSFSKGAKIYDGRAKGGDRNDKITVSSMRRR